jgi:hypothetical protein
LGTRGRPYDRLGAEWKRKRLSDQARVLKTGRLLRAKLRAPKRTRGQGELSFSYDLRSLIRALISSHKNDVERCKINVLD